jgi:hypothetical protein
LFVIALTSAAMSAEVEEGFVPIFNGTDLTGWEGKPGWWKVEEGAITAETTPEKPCKKCNYLMWRGGEPGDFELRLSYRIIGGNSGIQIRSRQRPDWDIEGYQADLEAGPTYSGALYEVYGRVLMAKRGEQAVFDEDGKRHVTSLGDPAELQKHIKPNDWNDYHITARGDEITLAINGVVMSKTIDRQKGKAAKKRIIALQVHPGPPMKVQFKNIRLKELD